MGAIWRDRTCRRRYRTDLSAVRVYIWLVVPVTAWRTRRDAAVRVTDGNDDPSFTRDAVAHPRA